jgi:hypothetical protein
MATQSNKTESFEVTDATMIVLLGLSGQVTESQVFRISPIGGEKMELVANRVSLANNGGVEVFETKIWYVDWVDVIASLPSPYNTYTLESFVSVTYNPTTKKTLFLRPEVEIV